MIYEISGYTDIDETYDSECPWIEFNEKDEIITSSNTESKMNQWLDKSLSWDEVGDYTISSISEYEPGFEIYSSLTELEREEIGMKRETIDEMNYYEEVVTVEDEEKLKRLLIKYDLPFYFQE